MVFNGMKMLDKLTYKTNMTCSSWSLAGGIKSKRFAPRCSSCMILWDILCSITSWLDFNLRVMMRKGHTVKGYVESKIERVYPLEHEYALVISWQSDHIILIFAMYKWTAVFVHLYVQMFMVPTGLILKPMAFMFNPIARIHVSCSHFCKPGTCSNFTFLYATT